MNERAPEVSSIENLNWSTPPLIFQVTEFSSLGAVNVWIEVEFSSTEAVLVSSPALPDAPCIEGRTSSTSSIVTVIVWSEVLPALSVALIITS